MPRITELLVRLAKSHFLGTGTGIRNTANVQQFLGSVIKSRLHGSLKWRFAGPVWPNPLRFLPDEFEDVGIVLFEGGNR